MIHTITLMPSVSRKAAGLYEAARRFALCTRISGTVEIDVFGLEDEHTRSDCSHWAPLAPRAFPVLGPARFGYSPGLTRALLEADADLVHAHGLWTYPSLACLQWWKRTRKPYLVSPHGMLDAWALSRCAFRKSVADLLFEYKRLRQARCIHTLCAAETEAVRAYGLRNPVCQIPNGVDLPEAERSLPPPWNGSFAPPRKVLLYLGRLHPKKGLANLLGAWALVKKCGGEASDWGLAVAGWSQNGHEAYLRILAAELGIAEEVQFIGPRFCKKKKAAYQNADALVLPSFSEGLPMVVLEAWAYGLPVLMTPACNLPEGFAADAALAIKPETSDIARGLLELFAMTEQERRAMGQRGLNLVRDRFTWPRVASELRAVYEWILGGGQRPACVQLN